MLADSRLPQSSDACGDEPSSASTAPDCLTCGCCCAWSETWPVLIGDRDGEGIPEDLIDLDNERMQSYGNRCSALEGKIGCRVGCSVYAVRPLVCREFQAGSDDCLMVRCELKLDPLAA
jgi:Fe-S-cluster containining protein